MLRPMIAPRTPSPSGTADWLCLAAAPTFALMALQSVMGGGAYDMLCAASHTAWPVTDMTWMYLLMGAFHAPPWLKLLAGRREPT